MLHPVLGPALLAVVLFLIFQAVFSWSVAPMDAIKALSAWLGSAVGSVMPDGWPRSLIVDGVIAGAGGVVVFLPQIMILFFFILVLEESGYLPRAAFLLDRIMGGVGLSGRPFIPLLSSFACAIPGIMATRSITNPRDRLVTIMIAPLMTCSARLRTLMMELPNYHLPNIRNVAIGLWQRVAIFMRRVGGVILVLTIAL